MENTVDFVPFLKNNETFVTVQVRNVQVSKPRLYILVENSHPIVFDIDTIIRKIGIRPTIIQYGYDFANPRIVSGIVDANYCVKKITKTLPGVRSTDLRIKPALLLLNEIMENDVNKDSEHGVVILLVTSEGNCCDYGEASWLVSKMNRQNVATIIYDTTQGDCYKENKKQLIMRALHTDLFIGKQYMFANDVSSLTEKLRYVCRSRMLIRSTGTGCLYKFPCRGNNMYVGFVPTILKEGQFVTVGDNNVKCVTAKMHFLHTCTYFGYMLERMTDMWENFGSLLAQKWKLNERIVNYAEGIMLAENVYDTSRAISYMATRNIKACLMKILGLSPPLQNFHNIQTLIEDCYQLSQAIHGTTPSTTSTTNNINTTTNTNECFLEILKNVDIHKGVKLLESHDVLATVGGIGYPISIQRDYTNSNPWQISVLAIGDKIYSECDVVSLLPPLRNMHITDDNQLFNAVVPICLDSQAYSLYVEKGANIAARHAAFTIRNAPEQIHVDDMHAILAACIEYTVRSKICYDTSTSLDTSFNSKIFSARKFEVILPKLILTARMLSLKKPPSNRSYVLQCIETINIDLLKKKMDDGELSFREVMYIFICDLYRLQRHETNIVRFLYLLHVLETYKLNKRQVEICIRSNFTKQEIGSMNIASTWGENSEFIAQLRDQLPNLLTPAQFLQYYRVDPVDPLFIYDVSDLKEFASTCLTRVITSNYLTNLWK